MSSQKQKTLASVVRNAALALLIALSATSRADAQIGAAPIPPRTIAPPPSPIFNVYNYGAVGNGANYDTAAIQAAINACAGTGGSVLLTNGSFVSAALELKSNMTFYVAVGATLLGGTNAADYPEIVPYTVAESLSPIWNKRSLLYANQADGLKLDGGGTIDGRGAQVNLFGTGGFMGSNAGNRPSILRIFQSDDVVVRNLDVRNPRMWTMVYDRCERLMIEHLNVNAPAYYANLDGMDIIDSRDVVIRNCVMETEDDAICLKSHSLTGMVNIIITNNFVTCHNANAIKIGTATLGPINNIRIENNTIKGAQLGGICIESVDGSFMNNVQVRRVHMEGVAQPIFVRLGNRPDWRTATTNHRVGPGAISNVFIADIRITNTHARTQPANTITGINGYRVSQITLSNILVEMPGGLNTIPATPNVPDGDYPQSNIFGDPPGYAFYVRYANDVKFENVTASTVNRDARQWLVSLDGTVTNVNCTDLRHTYICSNTGLDPHATEVGLPEVFGFRAGNTHGQTFQVGISPITLKKIRIGYGALSGTATATTFTLNVDAGNNGSNEISKQFTLTTSSIARSNAAPYGGLHWLDLDVSEFSLALGVGTHSFLLTSNSVTGPANSWLLAPAYSDGNQYTSGIMLGTSAAANRDANFGVIGAMPDDDNDNLLDSWEMSFPGITLLSTLNGTLAAGSGPGAGTGDFDGDGLSDFGEFTANTNPTLADSDSDGLNDGAEVGGLSNRYTGVVFGNLPGDPTNPLDSDSDDDTILDGEEVVAGADGLITNPNQADTDGDLYTDSTEIAAGSAPNNSASAPIGIPFRVTDFSNTNGWINRGGTTFLTSPELRAGSGQFARIDMATLNNGVVLPYPNPSNTVYCSLDFRVEGTFPGGTALANFNSGARNFPTSDASTHCIVRLFGADGSIKAYDGTNFLNVVGVGGIVSGVTYSVQIEHNIPAHTYGVRVHNRTNGVLIGSITGVPSRNTANPLADPLYFTAGVQATSTAWDLSVDNMMVSLFSTGVLRITAVSRNGAGQLVIKFTGEPNTNHRVTKSLTLQPGNFVPLGTPLNVTTGANGIGQAIVPVAEQTQSAAFFRLEKL